MACRAIIRTVLRAIRRAVNGNCPSGTTVGERITWNDDQYIVWNSNEYICYYS